MKKISSCFKTTSLITLFVFSSQVQLGRRGWKGCESPKRNYLRQTYSEIGVSSLRGSDLTNFCLSGFQSSVNRCWKPYAVHVITAFCSVWQYYLPGQSNKSVGKRHLCHVILSFTCVPLRIDFPMSHVWHCMMLIKDYMFSATMTWLTKGSLQITSTAGQWFLSCTPPSITNIKILFRGSKQIVPFCSNLSVQLTYPSSKFLTW